MSLLKKVWNLKYIKKYLETVKTVITSDKLLLTPDLSRGLILHNIILSTVSTVSFCRIIPFLSELMYLRFYKLPHKSSKYFREKKN